MSNGSDTFQVNVNNASGKTQANPTSLPVARPRGTAITVNWEAKGGEKFPDSGFFSWKTSSNPGSDPTRSSDGKTLTLNYTMPTQSVKWAYDIKLENRDQEDPEVDNQVPP